jgi:peptide/nickel transport system permease protein
MAPMLLVLFVLQLGWLPVTLGWPGLFSAGAVIPIVTLALGPLVFVVRQTRNSVLEVLSEDHVRTAHAMGLKRRVILVHHVIPNAMGPVINQTGLIFGGLLISSIFVESIFNIPGFGSLLFNSALNQDYPLLIGTTIVAMVVISIVYFLTDVLLAVIDPRVRLG